MIFPSSDMRRNLLHRVAIYFLRGLAMCAYTHKIPFWYIYKQAGCSFYVKMHFHSGINGFGRSVHFIWYRDVDEYNYDDVVKWKHFPHNWPFVRRIHRSPVNSPHKGQWRGALMFSSICVWIDDWVNNREAGDLRRYRAHYDVTVMINIIPMHMSSWSALVVISLANGKDLRFNSVHRPCILKITSIQSVMKFTEIRL